MPHRKQNTNTPPTVLNEQGKPVMVKFRNWNCYVVMDRYQHGGTPALRLIERGTNEQIARVTCHIPGVKLADNQVILKDFEENEGMLAAMEEAGLVTNTVRWVESGQFELPVVTLADHLIAQYNRQSDQRGGGFSR